MTATGTVYLVGAGPGAADLITRRGWQLLKQADVVLYDRLAGEELLREVRAGAELIDAGKCPGGGGLTQEQINEVLVARARAGKTVVRLKGGDPSLFGRSGEELEACQAAGLPCFVVPGVSSVLAASAALGIPLTRRGVSRSVAIWTARTREGVLDEEGLRRVALADTLVLLMGRTRLAEVTAALIRLGRPASTPAACISSVSRPEQRQVRGTLGSLAAMVEAAGLEAPLVTVIGGVVGSL